MAKSLTVFRVGLFLHRRKRGRGLPARVDRGAKCTRGEPGPGRFGEDRDTVGKKILKKSGFGEGSLTFIFDIFFGIQL